MALFVDQVTFRVEAGNGGHGCIAFLREKYRPRGGPCGGDGGRGGDVVLVVDNNVHTLLDFRHQSVFRAQRGQHGLGSNMTGRSGPHLEIRVPVGTEVRDLDTGKFLGDLTEVGQRMVVARGGRGGRGNQHFATPTHQAPTEAEDGGEGQCLNLELTLKLIADVGLVGFPNAGKSTLLSALSRARPKIGDYPFTTLEPNLGIVSVGEYGSFVMADIPGLIEGASEGKGLGSQFLRHVERTRVLLYLIDCTDEDPQESLRALRAELEAHSPELMKRRTVVALTKSDLLEPGVEPESASRFEEKPFIISAHARRGLKELVGELYRLVLEATAEEETAAAEDR